MYFTIIILSLILFIILLLSTLHFAAKNKFWKPTIYFSITSMASIIPICQLGCIELSDKICFICSINSILVVFSFVIFLIFLILGLCHICKHEKKKQNDKDNNNLYLNVPRGGYGILTNKMEQHSLITYNIWWCTALVGYDKVNGISFLCHFDIPCSASAIPEIVKYIMKLTPNHEFEIYLVSGTRFSYSFRTSNNIRKELSKFPGFKIVGEDRGYTSPVEAKTVIVDAKSFNHNVYSQFCGVSILKRPKMWRVNGSA